MFTVSNWVLETMLAKHLPDQNQIAEVAAARELPAFAEALAPDVKTRVLALKEIALHARRMNAEQLQETMTVAHFTQYFSDALSRLFYDDYQTAQGSWRAYTYADTVPDLRDAKRFRMGRPGGLLRRREKQQAQRTFVQTGTPISIGVDEFARSFDVSWGAILNDDLGKIRETPQEMARAAVDWLDQFVSDLYDNATLQATLAGMGAPWAGTGRLTSANLAVGITAMRTRTDPSGKKLSIKRVFLVIPPELEYTAADLLARNVPNFVGSDANSLGKFIAGVHVDPYIATAGANIPWYLIADPAEIPTVTVARMQGWNAPVVSMKRSDMQVIQGSAPAAYALGSFDTGDIEYQVADIVGGWDDASFVGVTDYRGMYYSSGTTA